MNDNLARVMLHIGGGDPRGGIWFAGIEEATCWQNAEHIAKVVGCSVREEHITYNSGKSAYARDDEPTLGYDFFARIACELSANGCKERTVKGRKWLEYRRTRLFWPNSGVFQINLWPLGKKNTDERPPHYPALFGLANWREYRKCVRRVRFPMIEEFWRKACGSPPVVCFGWSDRSAFAKVFGVKLTELSVRQSRVRVSDRPRVILANHWAARGNQRFIETDAMTVINILKEEWKISLP
jgi:hypothetical protein